MEALLVVGMLILVLGAYLAARTLRIGPLERPPVSDAETEVRLAVEGNPASPSVGRLVRDVAARMFASMPNLDAVVVRSRSGRLLGRAERTRPAPAPLASDPLLAQWPAHPFGLAHPHIPLDLDHDTVGQVVEHAAALPLKQRVGVEKRVAPPLTQALELPSKVSELVDDPDDPVALVRALVAASGRTAVVDRDVVLSGERAVVVLAAHVGEPVTAGMLNHAYLRFKESDVPRGVVVSPGVMPLGEIRRREMFDPALLHAGLDGLQRMADAVELGGDPVDFAAAPALTQS